MTRDREGTLVRFSPSRRSRGSWLTLARILPRASGAVETADLRHRTRTPHSASGRPCPKTRIHRQRTVILGALACGTTIVEARTPDLGSTEAQGRWHGDGRIWVRAPEIRLANWIRLLSRPGLWRRQRSWTLVCAAPDGGFRRLKKLFQVSSADGSSNKSARPLGGTWIPDSGSGGVGQ